MKNVKIELYNIYYKKMSKYCKSIIERLFDIKDKISDDDYLSLSNDINKIYQNLSNTVVINDETKSECKCNNYTFECKTKDKILQGCIHKNYLLSHFPLIGGNKKFKIDFNNVEENNNQSFESMIINNVRVTNFIFKYYQNIICNDHNIIARFVFVICIFKFVMNHVDNFPLSDQLYESIQIKMLELKNLLNTTSKLEKTYIINIYTDISEEQFDKILDKWIDILEERIVLYNLVNISF